MIHGVRDLFAQEIVLWTAFLIHKVLVYYTAINPHCPGSNHGKEGTWIHGFIFQPD